ncbi:sodium-dependent nutrient amino acid transporter 1-like isoform X1 [Phlebotomus argentipes]|uniref:sodium-dependent nutrient amino acid transporter 1-like isoform X1 n=1 Tax=Phlebotomus argentipes TaxID=94469 RepID=UPI0028931BA1|nr:sodium-dependent nutrient amino acid transporter 1-like isoform X1 [Phlebotomus argentipes]
MKKSYGVSNGGFVASTDDLKAKQNGIEIGEPTPAEGETPPDGENRDTWGHGIEFLMSCISMSVGLGNIWRFPFVAYENGGGAFLIPYIIVLVIVGKPMYFLEMILGQFTSRSSVKIWSVSPFFRGIGIGQMVGTCSVISYYCSMIGLTLNYFFSSFQAELPWSRCREEWGDNCVDSKPNPNQTNNFTQGISSSELYFMKEVLKAKDQIDDGIGVPDWKLTLWLLLAWVMVFVVICRGVKSSGKVAYFLAIFPYVVMITLLIRACTLEGSGEGILFFIRPQFSELLNPKVWYAATTQVFFSLSVGIGTIVMFSSYNRFDHNIYRDAMIVTTLDTFTSLLGGITMFAILGNLAHNLNAHITEVVKVGSGLAFISYPDAISKFDWVPQLFAVLFFFMLLVLGLGSVVALVSAVVTVLRDQFPKVVYWKMALIVSSTLFLVGLIYTTPGGQWMLDLVDHYGGTFLIFALAIVELVAIFWVYGLGDFVMDTQFMCKRYVGPYWRYCWALVTPVFMLIIFVYHMASLKPLTFGSSDYPDEAHVAGWILFAIGMVQLPLWAVYAVGCKTPVYDSLRQSLRPTDEWGPKNPKIYLEWKQFKADLKGRNAQINSQKNYSKRLVALRNFFGIYSY